MLYGAKPVKAQGVFEIFKLAQLQQQDIFVPKQAMAEIQSPLLRDSLDLLTMGLRPEDMKKNLETRVSATTARSTSHAAFLLTLSKLSPAFGLVGTLIGLVTILYEMGGGSGLEKVGPAMAISLTATLYGVAFANMIFYPMAEHLLYHTEQWTEHDRMILEGVIMLKEKRHSIHIRETLKSYLSKTEQLALEKMIVNDVKKGRGPSAVREKGVA